MSETFFTLRRIQQNMIMKMHIGLHVKYRYSCSILITLGVSKTTHIEFHENLSNGSRVVPCGRTGRHDEADSRFSQFCEKQLLLLQQYIYWNTHTSPIFYFPLLLLFS